MPGPRTNLAPPKGGPMGPLTTGHDAIEHDESPVHNWRVSQLKRFGISGSLAEIYADRIDWHEIARLVRRGCPPRLALRIVV
jgi:hypothetical protein